MPPPKPRRQQRPEPAPPPRNNSPFPPETKSCFRKRKQLFYFAGEDDLRACLKNKRGAAARDFGCGQGGEVRASPSVFAALRRDRAVAERRRAAGCKDRVNDGHGQKTRRPEGFRGKGRLASLLLSHRALRLCSFVAPCHPAFSTKTAPLLFFRQALSRNHAVGIAPAQAERGVHAASLFVRPTGIEHQTVGRVEAA
jgi:hypothetical protein